MARPDVLLSLVRAPALPPQHAYFGSQSHTPYDRCLRFGPRVAATPARLAPALPARLWTDQTCTGKLISASPIAPRMWLLPPVVDGEAPVRPRMKDARYGEPVVAELRGTLPHEPTPLAASLERAPPQVGHTEPERCQRPDVRWDRIVSEVASYDLPQPFPLFGDRPVHSAL